jgi:hypothetical protein
MGSSYHYELTRCSSSPRSAVRISLVVCAFACCLTMRGAKVDKKKSSLNPSGGGGGHHASSSSSDFSAVNPVKSSAAERKTPGRNLPLASAFMWLLNGGLVVASVFALSNWTAINWMTGSYGWAALLEIFSLLLLLYLFLIGTCLMGWSARVDSSFVHLADSPQLLYLFALALPFLVVSFFGALALLALGNLNATSLFVATHAEAVYKQAAVYIDPAKGYVDPDAFIKHICSLPSFIAKCTWYIQPAKMTGTPPRYDFQLIESLKTNGKLYDGVSYPFYRELGLIFTAMADGDNRLSPVEIYKGVQSALEPYKQRFGWSVLAITIICVLQFAYYWYKWSAHQRSSKKSKDIEKEQLPFIGP